MVGAVRFELTTSYARNKRASQATLRPDPEKTKLYAARAREAILILAEIECAGRGRQV